MGEWYCESHPESEMGHDGCDGAGIPDCARVSLMANRLRLKEQELREHAHQYQELIPALREQLAAKDAEIAELRKAMAAQTSAVRTLHWAKNEIANGQLQQAHALQQQSKPEALASERDANQQLTDALEQAERERDEARECVKRLQNSSQSVLDRWHAPMWQWYNQGPTAELMNDLRDALAATPEHLR